MMEVAVTLSQYAFGLLDGGAAGQRGRDACTEIGPGEVGALDDRQRRDVGEGLSQHLSFAVGRRGIQVERVQRSQYYHSWGSPCVQMPDRVMPGTCL